MRKLTLIAAMTCALVATPASAVTGPPLIFFDLGKDDITEQGAATLDMTVSAMAAMGPVRVFLMGHADRAGPADYNMRLSQRRASRIRTYLVQRGIPAGAIEMEAFGESRLLVETADGVPEPQNRRVEINWISADNSR